jgi:hypothetical protein
MCRGWRLTPSPTNNTHKLSVVNCLLYIVYYTSYDNIEILVLIKQTQYSGTKDTSLIRGLLHNFLSCIMLTLNSSLLWLTRNCFKSFILPLHSFYKNIQRGGYERATCEVTHTKFGIPSTEILVFNLVPYHCIRQRSSRPVSYRCIYGSWSSILKH